MAPQTDGLSALQRLRVWLERQARGNASARQMRHEFVVSNRNKAWEKKGQTAAADQGETAGFAQTREQVAAQDAGPELTAIQKFARQYFFTRLLARAVAIALAVPAGGIVGSWLYEIHQTVNGTSCENSDPRMGRDPITGLDKTVGESGDEVKEKVTRVLKEKNTSLPSYGDSSPQFNNYVKAGTVPLDVAMEKAVAPWALLIEPKDVKFNEYGDIAWEGTVVAQYNGAVFKTLPNPSTALVQSNWRMGIADCQEGSITKAITFGAFGTGENRTIVTLQDRADSAQTGAKHAENGERPRVGLPVLPGRGISEPASDRDRFRRITEPSKGNPFRGPANTTDPAAIVVVPQSIDSDGRIIPIAQFIVVPPHEESLLDANGRINSRAVAYRPTSQGTEVFPVEESGKEVRENADLEADRQLTDKRGLDYTMNKMLANRDDRFRVDPPNKLLEFRGDFLSKRGSAAPTSRQTTAARAGLDTGPTPTTPNGNGARNSWSANAQGRGAAADPGLGLF